MVRGLRVDDDGREQDVQPTMDAALLLWWRAAIMLSDLDLAGLCERWALLKTQNRLYTNDRQCGEARRAVRLLLIGSIQRTLDLFPSIVSVSACTAQFSSLFKQLYSSHIPLIG